MSIEIGTGLYNSPEGKVELDVNLTAWLKATILIVCLPFKIL
jgi:hypothetical protein